MVKFLLYVKDNLKVSFQLVARCKLEKIIYDWRSAAPLVV